MLDQVEASIFFSLRADLRAPHGAANSMPRATPAQSWGKGVHTFGSAPRLASVKGDLKPSSFFSLRDSIMNISHE